MFGRAYYQITDTFVRLERRRDNTQRVYHRALQDLRELQAARQPRSDPPEPPQPSPEPAPSPSSEKPNPTNGFVPPNPPPPLVNRRAGNQNPPGHPQNTPDSAPETA
jgi:hypothetical protein